MRRANFFDDQLLTADDLNFTEISKKFSAQELLKGLVRTPGVSVSSLADSGLQATATGTSFTVNTGRGFDANGNEIVVPSEVTTSDPGKGVQGDTDYRPAGVLLSRTSISITDLTNHTLKISIGYTELNDSTIKSNDKGTAFNIRKYNGYTITQTHTGSIPTNDLLLAEIIISDGVVTGIVDRRTPLLLFATSSGTFGNIVIVSMAGGQFTSVVSAINSITTASSSSPYTVLIYPGLYIETSTITLKDYVHIVGFGPDATVIQNDTSTTISGALTTTILLTGIKVVCNAGRALDITSGLGQLRIFNSEFTATTEAVAFPSTLTSVVRNSVFNSTVNIGAAVDSASGSCQVLNSSFLSSVNVNSAGILVARNSFFKSGVTTVGNGNDQKIALTHCLMHGALTGGFITGPPSGSFQLLHCTFPNGAPAAFNMTMAPLPNIAVTVIGCIYKTSPIDVVFNHVMVMSGSIDNSTNVKYANLLFPEVV